MRLHIDWTRCDGHGSCADLLPDLLTRDDWGFPIVRSAPSFSANTQRRIDLAVQTCPTLALKVTSVPKR